LQRAAAFSGAAEPQELSGEDDSDGEVVEFMRNRTESWIADTEDWVTDDRAA
jgi:hypothetical protein